MPSQPQNQEIKIIDRQTYPFLLIQKIFFARFTPTFRAILAYLAMKYYGSNEKGTCEKISYATMAKRMNTSKNTIIRGVEELEKKGVVLVHKRSKKSPKGERVPLPNLYELVDLQATAGEPI
jgi:DNA-binding MarR family transcriptional regulator